ncbi:gypsy type transposase [Tanacetum coccineum]
MNSITDIKCILSQKAFDAFYEKYHIPEEVHPDLPNRGDTMHERPTGKIGLHTRHFRINISQLSVIGATKVSHFEILCRVYGIIPTVGLFRCFYVNSKKSGWMLFSKRSDNAFVYMDIFAFIQTPDPTKVRVVERERKEKEPLLLKTTIGRTVPLLPVVPVCAESELGASVDRLFDEGAVATVAKDVAPLQPRRQRKRKTMVTDAGQASHPLKKLKDDHGTPSGLSIAGKSRYAVQRLLAGAVLNAEVMGKAIPTLPFVTSSVFAMPKHSSHHSGANVAEAEVDSLVRSSIPVITAVTTITSTTDPARFVKEKPVKPSLFSTDSSSAGRANPYTGVFSNLTGSDFLVSGIHTIIDPDTDLQKVYVPQWSVTNGSLLDDGRVCREMVDEFAPSKFFASVRGMKREQLFTEFNVGAACQMSLSAEVRLRAEYNIKEKRKLKSVVDEQAELLKAEMKALKERNTTLKKEKNDLAMKVTDLTASVAVRDRGAAILDTLVISVKSQNENLMEQIVAVYENCMGHLEKFQDDRMKEVNDKFDKLYADFIEMALHLEERFYPHLLITIFSRRWLLTHGMELAIYKCLNSPEYLSFALGHLRIKAIEKGNVDGLSAGITHGKKGRVLTDVAAYNPSAEVDYISALQQLQNVNFPLLAELKSNKDASIEVLMVPIHHSPDKVVVGASALSLASDVFSSRVWKIKENIANHKSALRNVFVPLAELFSSTVVIGTEGTSKITPGITTALSTTFASASSIPPISINDYEIASVDGQEGADVDGQVVTDGNADPLPNVDDADLNIP